MNERVYKPKLCDRQSGIHHSSFILPTSHTNTTTFSVASTALVQPHSPCNIPSGPAYLRAIKLMPALLHHPLFDSSHWQPTGDSCELTDAVNESELPASALRYLTLSDILQPGIGTSCRQKNRGSGMLLHTALNLSPVAKGSGMKLLQW